MKVNILETRENPLLKRKELICSIEHEGDPTPSKAAVQAYIAKTEKVKPKSIEIKKIFSPKGGINSKVLVYFWREKEVPVLEEKKPETKEAPKSEEEKPKEEPKPEEKPKEEEPKKEPKEEPAPEEADKEEKKEEKGDK